MNESQTPQRRRTDDGSYTLFHPAYGEPYHSRFGAWQETDHVFLQAGGIAAQLAAGQAASVLEVGLGTGLNFLATAELSLRHQTPLQYVALEKDWLPAVTLAGLGYETLLSEARPLYDAWLAWRQSLPNSVPPGVYRKVFPALVTLVVYVGDATRIDLPPEPVDAIYHDAFSPDSNPELWTAAFFGRLLPLLKPGGNLTSYSVKGSVRRALIAAGYTVRKAPGPPGKREMLIAHRPNTPESAPHN